MTAKELITVLKKCDPEKKVCFFVNTDTSEDIECVMFDVENDHIDLISSTDC